jgi:tripartite-type tricarboxylate transporter receptor subunit TctC
MLHLMLVSTAQFAVNVSVYPNLSYEPVRDFDPISTLALAPYILVTHPSVPAKVVPGYESEVWYLVAVPAGTPKKSLQGFNTEFVKALGAPAIRQQFEADRIVSIGNTPGEARECVRTEIAKWARVVKSAGGRVD